MKRKALFFLLISAFFGCQDIERLEKPDDFIKREQFKDILYDVSLINAARDFSRGQLINAGIEPDSFIYKKYNIDSLQFAQNMAYYSVDFSDYQKIWEEVSARIEQKRKEVDSLVRRQDSIDAVQQNNDNLKEEQRTGLMDPDELKRNSQD